MAISRKRLKLGSFVRQYGRKAYEGESGDPNDRKYDLKIERAVKSMPAEELDRLIREEDDDLADDA